MWSRALILCGICAPGTREGQQVDPISMTGLTGVFQVSAQNTAVNGTESTRFFAAGNLIRSINVYRMTLYVFLNYAPVA